MQYGNMKKVAYFDIDGTLLRSMSSERIFFSYLVKKKIIMYRDLARYAGMFLLKLITFQGIYARRNKSYIKGNRYEDIVSVANDCFEERISHRISKAGMDEMNRLRNEGYKITLLTGTLDPLMECFKAYCEADEGIGTTLETVDGIITGRVDGIYPYHKGKAEILENLAKRDDVDHANSYAFANEVKDIDFMQMVGNPVAVNPDNALKEFALRNSWKVVDF